MEKLYVNKEACIGCGVCVATDPEHFDFGDDGLSEVISEENIDTENVKNAMASCPTNAINYAEAASEEEHNCEGCDKKDCCRDTQELDEEIGEDFNPSAA